MSRVLGKINEVNDIAKRFKETQIPKYKKDIKLSSWYTIESVVKNISVYLPDTAIDYLYKDKINLETSHFRKYTFISVPETPEEKRIIRFPSSTPIEEFEREYAFYLGCLLSFYQCDTEEELLELGKEYDDLLPLYLDYIYLKHIRKEELFAPKFMDRLKHSTKNFPKVNKKYDKFYEHINKVDFSELSDQQFDWIKEECMERDSRMEEYTLNNIIRLSSMNGVLQLIDQQLSINENKELIEKLMLNNGQNRSSILYDYGVDSFGYKRLKKELNNYKR